MLKLALLLALTTMATAGSAQAGKSPDRLKWFREARFGMFIHWGLYSVPAGKWGDATGHGEWIRETAKIPVDEYEQFQKQFNPTKFNADAWAKIAKHAGMKYVVITTKHHDGFGLFKSKLTDWDIEGTPYNKDIMAEIARAYRAQGFHIGWYHSIMDWHHPDYLPRRGWEVKDRPNGDANFDRYNAYLHGQVSELLTNYGKIDLMWFDGEWENTWNHKYGQSLYDLCRKLQPNVVVNNRVDVGRGGMGGMSDAGYAGDYGTPEQEVPATGIPGVTWETCMTTNDHWGYNAWDKNFKSAHQLVKLLVDVVSKGGNLLLNVGPKADGTLPEEQVARLEHIGNWMDVNSEAIYGTTASPFGILPWGRATQKGRTIYLHVFDAPKNGRLELMSLGSKIKRASVLGQGPIKASLGDHGVTVDTSRVKWNADATVIKLELAEPLRMFDAPVISRIPGVAEGAEIPFVGSTPFVIKPPSRDMQVFFTLNGTEPTMRSHIVPTVGGSVISITQRLKGTFTVTARCSYKGRMVGPISRVRFVKTEVWPAQAAPPSPRDISVTRYEGDFDLCTDMKTPGKTWTQRNFDLGAAENQEHVGLVYESWVNATADDIYSFATLSDDGSRLFVDGKLVVDNDKPHGPQEVAGTAPLAKGWHQVKVEWFNKTGGAALKVKWSRRK